MKLSEVTGSFERLSAIYDPTELAILFDWLGTERPEQLQDIDIAPTCGINEIGEGRIRLVFDMDGGKGEHALDNAVARLVLSGIQDRLPQWAVVYADGRVDLARAYTPRRQAKIDLLPRFLFEINWADSGPGYSWPEAYHVVYLPGFGRYVVTASQDSPDIHGYTDEAIGHFPETESVEAGVYRVIFEWWKGQASGWDQLCWAYLLSEGEVSRATAESWADEIWDPHTGQPLSLTE